MIIYNYLKNLPYCGKILEPFSLRVNVEVI